MTPRYTDLHRWPHGYATTAQSREPGYLAQKFAQIRERIASEKAVVTQIKPKLRAKT